MSGDEIVAKVRAPSGRTRRKAFRALSRPCAVAAAALLSGCLYSTHNFGTGRLLPEGRSEATVGVGRQPVWRCANALADSASAHLKRACGEGSALEAADRADMPKASLGYRLGLRNAWGPFPGLELKWHLEAPTNPATMEFGLNLALPAASGAPDSTRAAGHPQDGGRPLDGFNHALGAGWGIGAWADKTFYLEYAASARIGPPRLFGNLRVTYLATQIGEVLGEDFAKPFPSNQHWVFQAGLGAAIPLGDWAVLPDVLVPGFAVTLPQIPSGDKRFSADDIPLLQWDVALGLAWSY